MAFKLSLLENTSMIGKSHKEVIAMVKKSPKPKAIKTQNDTTVGTDIDAAITAVQAVDAAIALPRTRRVTEDFKVIYKKLNRMKGNLHKL